MGTVYTLRGSVDADELGAVLPHEHLPMHYHALEHDRYEPGSTYIIKEWYPAILDELAETPCATLVDCSPIGHGRDPALRKELLGDRPLHVVMSTGFYLDTHQPQWAFEKSAEECADIMVRELEEGIGDSGVRAGIIKLAPDAASGQSRKLCRAAASASEQTGARITTHSCNRNRETFDLLCGYGAQPERIYVGHADFAETEENDYVCRNGGNVLFTVWEIDYMIPADTVYRRFAELVRAGHTDRVLMSVDFAIMVLDPASPTFLSWTLYGVEGRTHAFLWRKVIPTLTGTYDVSEEEITAITVENPRRMLDFRS
jgi:phosphotriesterase-related protein